LGPLFQHDATLCFERLALADHLDVVGDDADVAADDVDTQVDPW
jgi:hypothetical protein